MRRVICLEKQTTRTIGEWLELYKLYNKVYLKAIVSGVVFILLFY
jgi:hypothetical protein